MRYFPVSWNVKGRPVRVIGGGEIVERRVVALLECGAEVTVIAPDASATIRSLARSGSLNYLDRRYRNGDLEGAFAVFAGTDDREVNEAAWREATRAGIPINVADDPERCDFIMPALVRRGRLSVAISTDGQSPALAARLRRHISALVGPEYGRLLGVLEKLRDRLKRDVPDPETRRKIHYRLVDSDLLGLLRRGEDEAVEDRIEAIVRESEVEPSPGTVYIVGGGPGDPGLITLRGLVCLRSADVVLHDRLIDPGLLDEAKQGAEVIDVGKRAGDGGRSQERIEALMIERAFRGQTVCRLKGGDPFVFGRGGEEARALTEARVRFEIVPGVSSAIAVPGVAGIPVTHRGTAHSFTVMTGSRAEGAEMEEWLGARSLIAGGGSVIVLMGLSRMAAIIGRLIDAGCPLDTPAAVISRGTFPDQRVVVGTLADIDRKRETIVSPAVIVFGQVVEERRRLAEIRLESRPVRPRSPG